MVTKCEISLQRKLRSLRNFRLFLIRYEVISIYLGARAPLELAHVKKKKKEKVSNSNNLLYPASTSTLLDGDSLRWVR